MLTVTMEKTVVAAEVTTYTAMSVMHVEQAALGMGDGDVMEEEEGAVMGEVEVVDDHTTCAILKVDDADVHHSLLFRLMLTNASIQ